MDPVIIAAIIAAFGAICAAAIPLLKSRGDRTDFDLPKEWTGWSLFLPLHEINPDKESIYRVDLTLKLQGRRINMTETISEIYDIDFNRLEYASRNVLGTGRYLGNRRFVINFETKADQSNGTMYLIANPAATVIEGYLVLENPYYPRPASVAIFAVPKSVEPSLGFQDTPLESVRRRINESQRPS